MGGVISVLRIFSKSFINMKTILVFFALFAMATSEMQRMTLHHDGKSDEFTTDCNNLGDCREGWNNNEGKAYTMHGMWCFYENVDFNANGESECFSVLEGSSLGFLDTTIGEVSSFRHVGRMSDISSSTINIYTGVSFMGTSLTTASRLVKLEGELSQSESIIITGSTSWLVYSCDDFQEVDDCQVTCLLANEDGTPKDYPFVRENIQGRPALLNHQIR